VEQRQPGDRPGEDPRSGDLGHPGGEDQPDTGPLELPTEATKPLRPEPPRARAGHDIDPEPLRDVGRLVLGADDGHARDRVGAVGAAGAYHGEAGLGHVAQGGDQAGEVAAVTHDDHRVAESSVDTLGAEPAAPDPPGDEETRQPERERDEEEATGQLQLE
jgi:hypothetical protein